MAMRTDDPRRPLYLALRAMWTLGALYCALAVVLVLPVLTPAGPPATFAVWLASPGVTFLLLAWLVRRGVWWAVLVGIAVATLCACCVALVLAVAISATGWDAAMRGRPLLTAAAAAAMVVAGLIHVQVVWHLCDSFAAIRLPEVTRHGFDPVLVPLPRPALPVEADDAPPAAR